MPATTRRRTSRTPSGSRHPSSSVARRTPRGRPRPCRRQEGRHPRSAAAGLVRPPGSRADLCLRRGLTRHADPQRSHRLQGDQQRRQQARGRRRPRHRLRHHHGRRQDLEVHAQGRRQVLRRDADHVCGLRQTFERLFASFINQGPTYIQQWMADTSGSDYRSLLPDGPYKGKHLRAAFLRRRRQDHRLPLQDGTPRPAVRAGHGGLRRRLRQGRHQGESTTRPR